MLTALAPAIDRRVETPHRSSRGGRAIDHIVMHYTTSRNIGGSIAHFADPASKVSAHYIVGQDGELVQVVPDTEVAWHAGSSDMNARSIGIEHVAAPGDRITEAQEATSAALIRWLCDRYSIPAANIIPHAAVKATSCPGDLFGAYGGKAGADGKTQGTALQAWLAARVFVESKPEPEQQEVAMSDPTIPAPTFHPEAQPASASLTIWGAAISALSMLAPVLQSKWGIPVTPEIVTGVAGIIMTIIGRAATAPLKLR